MRILTLTLLALALMPAPSAASPEWADATPTAWHQLARAESLLFAPEPPNPVAVCVVDSGVNITPDLEGVVIERLAYDGGDPGDTYPQEGIDDGHGTYVATFLAGQVNGWGGAGLWPRAKIVSVRVFPPGAKRATAAAYLRGLSECVQNPSVAVINLSLGDVDASAAELAELEDRINDYRRHRNYNIVAAAGNRAGKVDVPARFPAALAVAATDGAGLCAFSARGPEVDLLAPGCALTGADQHGRSVNFSGTSFAAPMVSAVLAALRSQRHLTADAAERELLAASRNSSGGPVLDVEPLLDSLGLRPLAGTPIPDAGATSRDQSSPSDFILYPRPQIVVRFADHRRALSIKVLNRPRGAAIEVLVGRSSSVRGRTFQVARGRRARVRFISDSGFSKWVVIASRRHSH
jgi:subtilisin family serine protease